MKKIRQALEVLLLACLLFTVCVNVSNDNLDSPASVVDETDLENSETSADVTENLIEEMTVDETLQIRALEDAIDTILSGSIREFLGNHPVDESFLMFVAKEYGANVIEEIADDMKFDDPQIWFDKTGASIHVLWYEYCQTTNLDLYENDRIVKIETADPDKVVLDFTGDLILAENVATTVYMDKQPGGIVDCFSPDLIDRMKAADIMMINNEFAYTDRGEALDGKAFTFRGNPKRIDLLDELGVDIVNLANNHVFDYGLIGMEDTLTTVKEKGMPFVGAGDNIEDAMRPFYYIAGGRKIAIVAATQIERSYNYTKQATDTTAGVLKSLNDELFCQEIREAKGKADKVIVFIHWGTEGTMQHGGDQVALAKDFIAAGADVIVGGHTHTLQSVEYIGDVPVYYSLGNFYFSTTMNMPKDYDTGMAEVVIGKDGEIDVAFIPCHFSKGVLSMTEGEESSRIYNMLNDLSSTAVMDKNGMISSK